MLVSASSEDTMETEKFMHDFSAEEESLLREVFDILLYIPDLRLSLPPVASETGPPDLDQTEDHDQTILIRQKWGSLDVSGSAKLLWDAEGDFRTSFPPLFRPNSRLGSGALDALQICGECGWLYHRVDLHVQRIFNHSGDARTNPGAVSRAFGRAVQAELQWYRDFVASLSATTATASLRSLLVTIQVQAAPRLLRLAVISDGVAGLRGASLLQALYRHASRHGDSRHVAVARSLLEAAARPWFRMFDQWISRGVLQDPAGEFFVCDGRHQQEQPTKSWNLWHDGYRLLPEKFPLGLFEIEFLQPSFGVGKGINFIRKCLMDDEWNMDVSVIPSERPQSRRLGKSKCLSGEALILHQRLNQVSHLVHSRILDSLHNRFQIMDHLFALKSFLLLGQGDFFSALVQTLHEEFDSTSETGREGIHRYNLAAAVEATLRGTNAKDFPPAILQCLRTEIRSVESASEHSNVISPTSRTKDSVWDVFDLEYDVPEPLLAVIHPTAMEQYKCMFRFLWDMRRLEHLLHATWRQSAILQHALQRMAQYRVIQVQTCLPYAQATVLLRQTSMVRQGMMHFVQNLKSYLMFEVLDAGWKQLVRDIKRSQTLDQVISAHDLYLRRICRKSLFMVSPVAKGSVQVGSDTPIGQEVDRLRSLCDDFARFQVQLFSDAQEEADRAAEKRKSAEQLEMKGDWGFEKPKETVDEISCFGLAEMKKLHSVDQMSKAFNHHMSRLLVAIGRVVNGTPSSSFARQQEATPSPSKREATKELFEYDKDARDDLDSLRALALQLDNNKYYGL
jgi:gamma-tubulin complex component 3